MRFSFGLWGKTADFAPQDMSCHISHMAICHRPISSNEKICCGAWLCCGAAWRIRLYTPSHSHHVTLRSYITLCDMSATAETGSVRSARFRWSRSHDRAGLVTRRRLSRFLLCGVDRKVIGHPGRQLFHVIERVELILAQIADHVQAGPAIDSEKCGRCSG